MHVYEASFLIVPSVSEDKVGDEFSAIRSGFEATGASVIAEGFPQILDLAYTMERIVDTKKQKFNTAYFGWIKFDLPVASISNIKDMLDKNKNVLRHLIIKTVRENTMYTPDLPETSAAELSSDEVPATEAEKSEKAGKEIDKTIDALVIS